jgi:hypothetical protein
MRIRERQNATSFVCLKMIESHSLPRGISSLEKKCVLITELIFGRGVKATKYKLCVMYSSCRNKRMVISKEEGNNVAWKKSLNKGYCEVKLLLWLASNYNKSSLAPETRSFHNSLKNTVHSLDTCMPRNGVPATLRSFFPSYSCTISWDKE